MTDKKFSPLLYLVTDRKWLDGRRLEDDVEKAILGGTTMVQLREKDASKEEIKALGIKLKAVCKRYGVPLIINDFPDVALSVGADGVHVGQGDMSIKRAREILGENSIIGASAHNRAEALRAENDGADYIGAGAVFGSSTKTDASYLSHDVLLEITKSVSIPAVAIGGISKDNILELLGTGMSGAAVVSAVLKSGDPQKNASEMLSLVKKAVGI